LREPLPLATIQEAVLEFLRDRDDALLFGAQAVDAYVEEPRMTQDVDILSTRAAELRNLLGARFHIAVRVRKVAEGREYRLLQVRKPKNRHLVDVRSVDALPPAERLKGVLVVTPAELVAGKVIAFHKRRGRPKSGTDWRDLALLLLKFPDLRSHPGPVDDRLIAAGADPVVFDTWRELAAQEVLPEGDDDGF